MTLAAPTTPVGYQATINPPLTDGNITVTAHLGTQTVSHHSGPIDATDPGPVVLTVVGDHGEIATLTIADDTNVGVLRETINSAAYTRNLRNTALDKPRTEDL